MMKLLSALFIVSATTLLPLASPAEAITKPEQLVTCLQNVIVNRLIAPERPSWEHTPAYIFAGKYIHASWHADPSLEYGAVYAPVGPKSNVYCDYPTDESGIPDRQNGFCRPNIENGDLMVTYSTFESGRQDTEKRIAFITGHRIFCVNTARP